MKFLHIVFWIIVFFTNIFSQNKKYEPVDGKIIGIWPHENRLRSTQKLNQLKNEFGFNYLLVAAPYGDAWYDSIKNSDYTLDHIVKQIYYPDYLDREKWFWENIYSLGNVYAYYFDEPLSRKFSFAGVTKLISIFADKGLYPKSKIYLGEINEYRAKRFERLVDKISYTGYGSKDKNGLDQIQSWKEWKNLLGERFSMLWIAAHEDSNHFRILFKAAKELGYNSIWFYQYEPLEADKEIPEKVIYDFCEAAVEFGFMKYKKE
ncbi:MAG: hypothetical protein N2321_03575 [Melioribacteraceae bacterium]|nr:hypothetical protein [Melioribacteraceae bacterium]